MNSGSQNKKSLENDYGLPSRFDSGSSATTKPKFSQHKLEAALQKANATKFEQDFKMMRTTQGLHAPLRHAMELNATKKVGKLPFLASSFASRDSLLHLDEEIGSEDMYNTHEFREHMGQPHAVVEKSLGLL